MSGPHFDSVKVASQLLRQLGAAWSSPGHGLTSDQLADANPEVGLITLIRALELLAKLGWAVPVEIAGAPAWCITRDGAVWLLSSPGPAGG